LRLQEPSRPHRSALPCSCSVGLSDLPPAEFEPDSEAADEAIAVIKQSRARICLVALGAPRQELFSARALDATTGIAFLGIGASLDFIAGTQTRCPQLLRRLNLEWAWRALSDPRRLAPRYVACAALFVRLYTHYAWQTNLSLKG